MSTVMDTPTAVLTLHNARIVGAATEIIQPYGTIPWSKECSTECQGSIAKLKDMETLYIHSYYVISMTT